MQITSQYAIALLLSAAISLALSLYLLRRRSTPGSTYFAFLMMAVAEWSVAAAFEAYLSDAGTKILFSKISYIGVAACPILFFLFALSHTSREKMLSRRNAALLCIMPVATILMAFTNEFHGLLWPSFSPGPQGTNILIYGHGPWFWINVAYSYAMMLASTILLAVELIRSPKFYKRQTATILIGSMAPWIGNAIYVFGFDPLAGLDLAPVFFSVCGIIITFGIYRFGLFNIVPVARNRLFNIMKGGVLVADLQQRIVDINPAAQRILETKTSPLGKPVADFLIEWPGLISHLDEKEEMQEEILLKGRKSPVWVEAQISKIYDRNKIESGWFLLLSDITERKNTEESLRESEDRYKTFFRTARDCVFITSAEGKWIDCNDAAVELFGYSSKDELIGKPSPTFYENPKDREKLVEIINRENFVKDFPTRLKRKDGRIMDVLITTARRMDASGNFFGYQGIIMDVTESKRSEKLLAKSEEQYRLLAENSLDVIWTLDNDLKFTYISPSIKSLRGITPEEAMTESIEDTMPPESFEKVAKNLQELMQKESEGNVGNEQRLFEIQQKRKDGSLIWVEIQAQVILDSDGKRIGFLGVSRNIENRKRTQDMISARLRIREFSATHSLKESIQKAIDEVENIAGSKVGFYHFVEPDQKTLSLQAWSTRTVNEFCTAKGEGMHYGIENAGVWVDCVHQRRPVIHNDYASLPNKKGMPEGHAKLVRELVVPIFREDKIVAILGIGNKETEYNDEDVKIVSYLADVVWEVARRKIAEESLRASEEKHRTLFETMAQGVVYQDTDGKITSANRAAERILGLTLDQMQGRTSVDPRWKSIHEDGSDFPGGTHPSMMAIKTGKEIKNAIMGVFNPIDGKHRWININATPEFREGEKKPYRAYTTFEDITDIKNVEKRLRETTEYLDSLLKYANAPIIVWNPNLIITRFNHAFEQITGKSAKDVIGKHIELLFPENTKAQSLEYIRSAVLGEKWENVEIPIIHTDGNVRILLWNSANISSPDEKLISVIAQGQDITERKRAEDALKETSDYLNNLFNYANAPIIVWGPDFKITRFNHAFEQITGKSAKDVIGKHIELLFPENTKAQSLEYIQKTTVYGERWETIEIPITHVNGTVRTLLWNSANIYAKDGKTAISTIAQGQDITERKKTEEAKAELEAVKRTSKMKDEFIALATHELHIPIAALKGYTEMLLSGKGGAGDLSDVARGLLETIGRNTDRLMRLADNLLEVQTIGAGTIQIEKKKIKLKKMLEHCAKSIDGALKAKKQEFKISIASGEFAVEGDEKRLETVFCALLDNASKFTPDKGKIRLDASENKNEIKIAISDTGIGIPKGALSRIFEPFANITKPDYFKGAGLSLSVAKGIIEGHGGKITVESEGEGKGATFTIILPKSAK